MKDIEFIEKLKSLIGQKITKVSYVIDISKNLQQNYIDGIERTALNADKAIHALEWQLEFSNLPKFYFSADENLTAKINIGRTTEKVGKERERERERKIFNLQDAFPLEINNILNKQITSIRLWKHILKSSKFLGIPYNLKYHNYYQIIEIVCENNAICLSAIKGDIGSATFYPTEYYINSSLCVFINKSICQTLTINGERITMKAVYSFGEKIDRSWLVDS